MAENKGDADFTRVAALMRPSARPASLSGDAAGSPPRSCAAMKVFNDFVSAMAALRPKRRRKPLPTALDVVGRQPPSAEALAVAREARRLRIVRKR